jgi:hypothetical protein
MSSVTITAVIDERVDHQQRAAGLAAGVSARTGEAVDDVEGAVGARHDRVPGMEVADEQLMLCSRVLLVVPERVRWLGDGGSAQDMCGRSLGTLRDREV